MDTSWKAFQVSSVHFGPGFSKYVNEKPIEIQVCQNHKSFSGAFSAPKLVVTMQGW